MYKERNNGPNPINFTKTPVKCPIGQAPTRDITKISIIDTDQRQSINSGTDV
ncbi:MAG: hypothetical protein ABW185_27220 [Sedimenticola sp.]